MSDKLFGKIPVTGTRIPAWTFHQVWRRYVNNSPKKKLEPFSDVALAFWTCRLLDPSRR